MATHSSVLAWRIPGMGEPGGLPSMGSHRVSHNWSDLAAATAACMNVRVGLQRKLNTKELMLLNCGVEEDSFESSLDCKEIQPVNPKGNQSWIIIGRTDTEAETAIIQPPDVKNWLLRKDPDAGQDWRQEEKGMTEDKMVGWHHWFDGPEFEQALGVADEQGSLACCNPFGCKESDTTERLNWTEPRSDSWAGN